MASLDETTQRLEKAIDRLERAAGKLAVREKTEPSVLALTAGQVAARLDAVIGRLDRFLEE